MNLLLKSVKASPRSETSRVGGEFCFNDRVVKRTPTAGLTVQIDLRVRILSLGSTAMESGVSSRLETLLYQLYHHLSSDLGAVAASCANAGWVVAFQHESRTYCFSL